MTNKKTEAIAVNYDRIIAFLRVVAAKTSKVSAVSLLLSTEKHARGWIWVWGYLNLVLLVTSTHIAPQD